MEVGHSTRVAFQAHVAPTLADALRPAADPGPADDRVHRRDGRRARRPRARFLYAQFRSDLDAQIDNFADGSRPQDVEALVDAGGPRERRRSAARRWPRCSRPDGTLLDDHAQAGRVPAADRVGRRAESSAGTASGSEPRSCPSGPGRVLASPGQPLATERALALAVAEPLRLRNHELDAPAIAAADRRPARAAAGRASPAMSWPAPRCGRSIGCARELEADVRSSGLLAGARTPGRDRRARPHAERAARPRAQRRWRENGGWSATPATSSARR